MLALLVVACAARPQQAHEASRLPSAGYVPKAKQDSDKVPWAAAFANYSLKMGGVRGTGSPSALSFLTWGLPLAWPAVGAIAVFDYGGGRGHVGIVEGAYGDLIVVLGGNQSDAVSRTAFPKGEVATYRWPANYPLPRFGAALPTVRPVGAPETGAPPEPQAPAPRMPSAWIGTKVEYRLPEGGQHLTIERLDQKRLRFQLVAGSSCARTLSGLAYRVYDGDVEIDSDAGVGYAADEFLFWDDELGKKGLSIRVSLFEPGRARVTEWGYSPDCSFAGGIMRTPVPAASPR